MPTPTFLANWAVATLVCMALLSLYPQIRFKPQRRVLTIDEAGWTTEIGKSRGSIPWTKVRSIEDDGEVITITGVNRNALVVPMRAFSDEAQRREFLENARRWQASAATRSSV